MKKTIQFHTDDERELYMEQNSHLTLIAESNITEGNFLVFSDNPVEDSKQAIYINVPEEEFKILKQDNTLLKAQSQANSDVIEFHEEVLAEIIVTIVP